MRETDADLERLQGLLDASYEAAGAHLRSIITPERRVSAPDLSERLRGMCLLALATVTADGRPLVGPVDGLFYRGEFWFGSAPDSVRFRHIAQRPVVSATHAPEEAFSVTVHGRAVPEDAFSDQGFAEVCVEIYGPDWRDWGHGARYARIQADRMFTFLLHPSGE